MKAAKNFVGMMKGNAPVSDRSPSTGSATAKNFNFGGFDPVLNQNQRFSLTAQATPLGGKFKNSGTYPKQLDTSKFSALRPFGGMKPSPIKKHF
ncbi:hypothetical protein V757_11180 [Pelistega indica]|uniref:Uncharacterized protein n=1 Tax=Pelistega indica TaxID=1414851 RepID=V8FTD6_9BURK|nr:hypothetical protein [Pelistega indica]ETD67544.1 hypothetical protein V757_11180 [Pelistega indica]